jgi:hypothetical protein
MRFLIHDEDNIADVGRLSPSRSAGFCIVESLGSPLDMRCEVELLPVPD